MDAPASGIFTPQIQLRAAILGGALLFSGVLIERVAHQSWGVWLAYISLGIGLIYGGKAALEALRELKFDIDVLMVVGAILAAAIGHPEEGALLLFLFVLSGALEDLAMLRTQREIEALAKLMPSEARLSRDGAWVTVTPESLTAGDRIQIRPGDRVPADCRVASGSTSLDQSAITGESIPRDVQPGDDVFAGTINVDDPIEAVVTRAARESSLQKILALVTQAREEREPAQRLIDKLDQPYSIGVFLTSIAIFLLWWLVREKPIADATYTAITLLIVASPCALIIATPTATLATIARGARSGVLFKGGRSIEALARIKTVCFDKTGTLTVGRPQVGEIHTVAWSDGERLLAYAAALEEPSSHPIAAAIKHTAKSRGIEPASLNNVTHTTGRGMSGLSGHCPVRLGSYIHAEELIPECFRQRVKDVLAQVQSQGNIAVVVSHACPEKTGGGEAAVIIMEDSVRPGAAALVPELHALGVEQVRMLTGDNRRTAEHVATALHLDRCDAELLPEDKVRLVKESKIKGPVAVIGDGVNDAPALAAADVSIGIGSIGTDAALENADIVLLSDDLSVMPWSLRLAKAARRTININIVFALSIIAIMATLTLLSDWIGIKIPLSLGVLAHEGGTLLVVGHSLLLLAFASPKVASVKPLRPPAALSPTTTSTRTTPPATTSADADAAQPAGTTS